ncbi:MULTISPECIES: hypothetical protein [Bacillus cereus group]|nr:hypothetical protein [Bacillus paranthracis]
MKNMKFVEEKEYTYIIEEQNISTIIKNLDENLNSGYFDFNLNKVKSKSKLHFIFSDNFEATRTNNGLRKRI